MALFEGTKVLTKQQMSDIHRTALRVLKEPGLEKEDVEGIFCRNVEQLISSALHAKGQKQAGGEEQGGR